MILNKNLQTVILILIAFVFSVAVRFIWVYQFKDVAQYKFNNEFMINTNDGYFYAKGAKDILSNRYQNDLKRAEFERSPIEAPLSIITALIAKYTNIKFETILFYLSGILSSLLVIPIILIGRSLGKIEVGFIAALLSSIAWSYYNRTMFGYYDTDMLNIVFPIFLLWSLILAINSKNQIYFLLTSFEIIAYRLWYPQSYALEFAFIGLLFLYFIYLTVKKIKNYQNILSH